MNIIENHALASHTTLNIGGCAKKYIEVANNDELLQALEIAKNESLPVFVLGGGSNTLICDEGFEGVVIHFVSKKIDWSSDKEGRVTVDAGCVMDDFVAEACRKNLAGIESLSGIPGTVGGAVVQNIGAYGQELSEVFVEANVYDLETEAFVTLNADDMQFGYRTTSLKSAHNKRIVLSATFELKAFDAEKAMAVAVEHGFKKVVLVPPKTASDMRNRVINTRKTKAMCYDPDDVNTHSVGSFFVNPVVSLVEAERIKGKVTFGFSGGDSDKKDVIPMYPAPNGIKLSAAWLIEKCGFDRGYSYEGAALSAKHCLAIINPGHATARGVIALASLIAQKVRINYQVSIQPEIIYLAQNGIASLPLSVSRF